MEVNVEDVSASVLLIDHSLNRSLPISFGLSSESLKDLVAMEVDGQSEVKSELPTPPASDVGSPTSYSHCGSDSEPDSPMVEDTKVCCQSVC